MKFRAILIGAAILAAALPAFAQDGGQVVAGDAVITTPDLSTTVVDQSTEKAIINWSGFSIDSSELVRFNQPGASSVTLNRVTGGDISSILGTIEANGSIFLLNPNGIVFGAGSRVNVGGLVASTLSMGDDDFLAGNYHLVQDPSAPLGAVINQGDIVAENYAALVAPLVENGGSIVSPGGTIYMLGTSEAILDITGDGLIGYSIGNVHGGTVQVREDALSDVVRAVVNTDGLYEAASVEVDEDGTVRLVGAAGTAVNSGTLDATGGRGDVVVRGSGVGALTDSSVLVSDGGLLELSGQNFQWRGVTTSPGGTFLLDPTNVVVDAAMALLIEGDLNTDTSVVITTAVPLGPDPGNITIDAPITRTAGAAPVALTFDADANITVNAAIGNTSGVLMDVLLLGDATAGAIDINASITTGGGLFVASGNTFDNTGATITAGTGGISIVMTGDVTVGDAMSGAAIVIDTTSPGSSGQISVGAFGLTSSNGDIELFASEGIDLTGSSLTARDTGAVVDGRIDLDATDDIVITDSTLSADRGITLDTAGGVFIDPSTLTSGDTGTYAGDIGITATGVVSILGGGGTSMVVAEEGSVSITASGAVTITDSEVNAEDNNSLGSTFDVTIAGDSIGLTDTGVSAVDTVDFSTTSGDITVTSLTKVIIGDDILFVSAGAITLGQTLEDLGGGASIDITATTSIIDDGDQTTVLIANGGLVTLRADGGDIGAYSTASPGDYLIFDDFVDLDLGGGDIDATASGDVYLTETAAASLLAGQIDDLASDAADGTVALVNLAGDFTIDAAYGTSFGDGDDSLILGAGDPGSISADDVTITSTTSTSGTGIFLPATGYVTLTADLSATDIRIEANSDVGAGGGEGGVEQLAGTITATRLLVHAGDYLATTPDVVLPGLSVGSLELVFDSVVAGKTAVITNDSALDLEDLGAMLGDDLGVTGFSVTHPETADATGSVSITTSAGDLNVVDAIDPFELILIAADDLNIDASITATNAWFEADATPDTNGGIFHTATGGSGTSDIVITNLIAIASENIDLGNATDTLLTLDNLEIAINGTAGPGVSAIVTNTNSALDIEDLGDLVGLGDAGAFGLSVTHPESSDATGLVEINAVGAGGADATLTVVDPIDPAGLILRSSGDIIISADITASSIRLEADAEFPVGIFSASDGTGGVEQTAGTIGIGSSLIVVASELSGTAGTAIDITGTSVASVELHVRSAAAASDVTFSTSTFLVLDDLGDLLSTGYDPEGTFSGGYSVSNTSGGIVSISTAHPAGTITIDDAIEVLGDLTATTTDLGLYAPDGISIDADITVGDTGNIDGVQQLIEINSDFDGLGFGPLVQAAGTTITGEDLAVTAATTFSLGQGTASLSVERAEFIVTGFAPPTDILVDNDRSLELIDLTPFGAGFSVLNTSGGIVDILAADGGGTATILVSDDIDVTGDALDPTADLTLSAEAGVTIEAGIDVETADGSAQLTVLNGDNDGDGTGFVTQTDTIATFVNLESASVLGADGGISLGQGISIFEADTAEFILTSGAAAADILVNNDESLVLDDLGVFGGGFSVFNNTGGVVEIFTTNGGLTSTLLVSAAIEVTGDLVDATSDLILHTEEGLTISADIDVGAADASTQLIELNGDGEFFGPTGAGGVTQTTGTITGEAIAVHAGIGDITLGDGVGGAFHLLVDQGEFRINTATLGADIDVINERALELVDLPPFGAAPAGSVYNASTGLVDIVAADATGTATITVTDPITVTGDGVANSDLRLAADDGITIDDDISVGPGAATTLIELDGDLDTDGTGFVTQTDTVASSISGESLSVLGADGGISLGQGLSGLDVDTAEFILTAGSSGGDILVTNDDSLVLDDLAVFGATYSLFSDSGGIASVETSGGATTLLVSADVDVAGDTTPATSDLILSGVDGLTIEADVTWGSTIGVQIAVFNGDSDGDGTGFATQTTGLATTIDGESLSVLGADGGITLGRGSSALDIDTAEFVLTSGASGGDILVTNDFTLVLDDIGVFGSGFSVFSDTGGVAEIVTDTGGGTSLLTVSAAISVLGDLVDTTSDLLLDTEDGLTISADITVGAVDGSTQLIELNGDSDAGTVGGVTQTTGTITGEDIAVFSGSPGISLGQGGAVLDVSRGEFRVRPVGAIDIRVTDLGSLDLIDLTPFAAGAVFNTTTGVTLIQAADDLNIMGDVDATNAWFEADNDDDGTGEITHTAPGGAGTSDLIVTNLIVIAAEDIELGIATDTTVNVDNLEIAITGDGPAGATVTVLDTIAALDLEDLDTVETLAGIGEAGIAGFSVTHPATADATGLVEINVVGAAGADAVLRVVDPIDPAGLIMRSSGDIDILASITADDIRLEADAAFPVAMFPLGSDGSGGIFQSAGTITGTNLIAVASAHSSGSGDAIDLPGLDVGTLEVHVRGASAAADVDVTNASSLILDDLGDLLTTGYDPEGGFSSGYSVSNPSGGIVTIETDASTDDSTLLVSGAIDVTGDAVLTNSDLALIAEDGLTIEDDISVLTGGGDQRIELDGDSDADNTGFVTQTPGLSTLIDGEELSVRGGSGGISLGQGLGTLDVDTAEFILTSGGSAGDILVLNSESLVLDDIGVFGSGFSVFNNTGGVAEIFTTNGGMSSTLLVSAAIEVTGDLVDGTSDLILHTEDGLTISADIDVGATDGSTQLMEFNGDGEPFVSGLGAVTQTSGTITGEALAVHAGFGGITLGDGFAGTFHLLVDQGEFRINPVGGATDIDVNNERSLELLDLPPFGAAPAGSVYNIGGGVVSIIASNAAGLAAMTVTDAVTVTGDLTDGNTDLYLGSDDGIDIDVSITNGAVDISDQRMVLNGDIDLDGFGGVIQSTGTIDGEELAVLAGHNGAGLAIDLGLAGGTLLTVDTAQFLVEPATILVTSSIEVRNTGGLVLTDIDPAEFGAASGLGYSVYHESGYADIRTFSPLTVLAPIAVRDDLRLEAAVDSAGPGSDNLEIYADIFTDLVAAFIGPDTHDSTIQLYAADDVFVDGGVLVEAEERIHICAGANDTVGTDTDGFAEIDVDGLLRTTFSTDGDPSTEGEIVLCALTGIDVADSVTNNLQAANTGSGDIYIYHSGSVEPLRLVDVDGMGFSITNGTVGTFFSPSGLGSVTVEQDGGSLSVLDDIFGTGGVNLITPSSFQIIDACIIAPAGPITLETAAGDTDYPIPGDNPLVILGPNACFVSYGIIDVLVIECDNDPTTNLSVTIDAATFNGTYSGRVVILSEGDVIFEDDVVMGSLLGFVVEADWQFCAPDGIGEIIGGDSELYSNEFSLGAAEGVQLNTFNLDTDSPSQFQIRNTTSGLVDITNIGDVQIVEIGLAFAAGTPGLTNVAGGVEFDAASTIEILDDVIAGDDVIFAATEDILIDADVLADGFELVFDADSGDPYDGGGTAPDGTGLIEQLSGDIMAADLIGYAAEGITLGNTFVSRAQLINTDSGDILLLNTGDLELLDLDTGGHYGENTGPHSVRNDAGSAFIQAASDILVSTAISVTGDVTLRAIGAPGSDVRLDADIESTGSGIIDIFARDSIIDESGASSVLITDGRIILEAELGVIGDDASLADYVDIDLGTTGTLTARAAGNLFIEEAGGDLEASRIDDFTSTGGNGILGLSSATGQVEFDAPFSGGDDSIVVTAATGVDVDAAVTTLGSEILIDTTGAILFGPSGLLSATDRVDLVAGAGGITQTGLAVAVLADQLVLESSGIILLNRTQVSELQVLGPALAATVVNTGDVVLTDILGTGSAVSVIGPFSLTALSDITVAAPVTAGSVTLAASGDVDVLPVPVAALAGDITFDAGNNIVVTAASAGVPGLSASGDVNLNAVGSVTVFDADVDLTFPTVFAGADITMISGLDVDLVAVLGADGISVTALNNLTFTGAAAATDGDIVIDSGQDMLVTLASLLAPGLSASGDVRLIAVGSLTILDLDTDVTFPAISAFADLVMDAGTNLTAGGFFSGGTVNLAAGDDITLAGGFGALDSLGTGVDIFALGHVVSDAVLSSAADIDVFGGLSVTLLSDAGFPISTTDTVDISSDGDIFVDQAIGFGVGSPSAIFIDALGGVVLDGIISGAPAGTIDIFGGLDVELGGSITSAGGTVFVTSVTGRIIDSNDAPAPTTNVFAGSLELSAPLGVGTSGNAIETTVITLAGFGGSGGFYVDNTGLLGIGSVGASVGISTTNSDIELSATGTITLTDLVDAGSGDVSITSTTGSIADGATASLNIVADDLILAATSGAIGSGDAIEIDATTLTAASDGDLEVENTAGGIDVLSAVSTSGAIDLTADAGDLIARLVDADTTVDLATTTSGDILVGYVEAGSTADLDSASAIEEIDTDPGVGIRAPGLILTAEDGIGHSGTIDIDADTVTATTTSGDVDLREDSDDLTVDSIATGLGSVRLEVSSGDALIDLISASASVTVVASGAINESIDDVVAADIVAPDIFLTAGTGIGTVFGGLEIDGGLSSLTAEVLGVGDIVITDTAGGLRVASVITFDGTITIGATGGDLIVEYAEAGGSGDIFLSTLTTGDLYIGTLLAVGDLVDLDPAGSAFDNNGTDNNITALELIVAAAGVGTSVDSIETTVSFFESALTPGGVFLDNIGDLTIGLGGGFTGVSTTASDIVLTTTGSMDVTEPITVAGAGNITVIAGVDLTIGAAPSSTYYIGGDRDIHVEAGRDIFQNEDIGSAFTFTARTIDVIAGRDLVMASGTGTHAISATLNVTTGRDMTIGFLSAGGVGLLRTVTLTAGGSILDGNGASNNVFGEELVITAGVGVGAGDAIESGVEFLEADVGSGGLALDNITVATLRIGGIGPMEGVFSAGGNIDITASTLVLDELIDAGTGDVILSSATAITDANGTDLNIRAFRLDMTAGTSGGSSGIGHSLVLETEVSRLTVDNRATSGAADVEILNTGDLVIESAVNADGDINITAQSDIDVVGDVTGFGVSLRALGDLRIDAASVEATAGSVSLVADGSITAILDSVGDEGIEATGSILLDAGLSISVTDLNASPVFESLQSGSGMTLIARAGNLSIVDAFLRAGGTLSMTASGTVLIDPSVVIGSSIDILGTDILIDTSLVNSTSGDIEMIAGATLTILDSELDADGGGSVSLTSGDDMLLGGLILPGDGATADDLFEAISGANLTFAGFISAFDISLNAVGTILSPFASLFAADDIDMIAGGDIDLVVDSGTGFPAISTGVGIINLIAGGSITVVDTDPVDGSLLAAADLLLDAGGNINLGGLFGGSGVTFGAIGDIDVVGAVGALGGSINITAGGMFRADAMIGAIGGGVTINGDAGITLLDTAGLSGITTEGTVRLTSTGEVNIGAPIADFFAGEPDEVHVTTTDAIIVGADITADAGSGLVTLSAGGNVTLIGEITTLGGGVIIGTTGGTISDVGGSNNVTAGLLDLSAPLGVGTSVNPIDVTVATLTGFGGTGGFYVDNSIALFVGGISTTGTDIELDVDGALTLLGPLDAGSGNVTLSAGGPIAGAGVVTGNTLDLTASGGITLGTVASALTASNDTAGDIVIVNTGDLVLLGITNTAGGIDVSVASWLTVAGDLSADTFVSLTASDGVIVGPHAITAADGDITIVGLGADVTIEAGALLDADDGGSGLFGIVLASLTGGVSITGATLESERGIDIDAVTDIAVTSSTLDATGGLASDDISLFSTTGGITIDASDLDADQDILVDSDDAVLITESTLDSDETLILIDSASAGVTIQSSGATSFESLTITADLDIVVDDSGLSSSASTVLIASTSGAVTIGNATSVDAADRIDIDALNDISISDTVIDSDGSHLDIDSVAGALTLSSVSAEAGGFVDVTALGDVTIVDSSLDAQGSDLSIGSSAGAVTLSTAIVDADSDLDVSADEDVTIIDSTLTSSVGSVLVTSLTGSILIDPSTLDAFVDIDIDAAVELTLDVATLIADADVILLAGFDLTVIDSTVTSTGGSIFATSTAGAILIDPTTFDSFFDITIDAAGDLVLIDTTLTAGDELILIAGGVITAIGDFTGATFDMTAFGDIDLIDVTGGLLVTTATSTDGSVSLEAVDGDLDTGSVSGAGAGGRIVVRTTGSTPGDVTVDDLTAETVEVHSGAAIIDGNGLADNLIAASSTLTAASGIGDGDAIEVVDGGTVSATNTTSGTVELAGSGDLTLGAVLNSADDVTVTAVDDLTVSGDVESTPGSVSLTAGEDFVQDPGTTVTAGDDLTVTAAIDAILGLLDAADVATVIATAGAITDGNDLTGPALNVKSDTAVLSAGTTIGTLANCIEVEIVDTLSVFAGGGVGGTAVSLCGTTGDGNVIVLGAPPGSLIIFNGLERREIELAQDRGQINWLLDLFRRRYDWVLYTPIGDEHIFLHEGLIVDERAPKPENQPTEEPPAEEPPAEEPKDE